MEWLISVIIVFMITEKGREEYIPNTTVEGTEIKVRSEDCEVLQTRFSQKPILRCS